MVRLRPSCRLQTMKITLQAGSSSRTVHEMRCSGDRKMLLVLQVDSKVSGYISKKIDLQRGTAASPYSAMRNLQAQHHIVLHCRETTLT